MFKITNHSKNKFSFFTHKFFYLVIIGIFLIVISSQKLGNDFIVSTDALTTSELQAQVNDYKAQLQAIKDQKSKLAKQIESSKSAIQTDQVKIKILQDQISEKELDIQELQTQISESESNLQILSNEQAQLQQNLDQTSSKIEKISTLAEYQLIQAYKKLKSNDSSNLTVLLTSKDFTNSSDFDIIISKKDKLVIEQLSSLKYNQDQQKAELDKNKLEAEKLNFSLIDQKRHLEDAQLNLKSQQDYLNKQINVLGIQINTNTNQQTQLTETQKKLEAQINTMEQQIFASIKTISNGTYVNKGDIIGYQGNTGNSTGEHLHFTLAINGVKVDGCKYVPNSGIKSNPSDSSLICNYGNGSVGLPQYNNPMITQAFGNTSLGYYHDGVDMVGPSGNAIRAVHDGYMMRSKYSCIPGFPIKCNGTGANYVKICENKDCSRGYSSLYIHLRD